MVVQMEICEEMSMWYLKNEYICIMRLYIFNPENDMALANGSPGYTPPANIVAYRREHWDLPRLWASPEDMVWDGESSLAYLFESDKPVPEICPWGWSPALVHQLEMAGVPRGLMPDDAWLCQLRALSSRENTVRLQQSLGIDASVCHTLQEVEQKEESWGRIVVKSPWSSSGKGLMQTDNPNWRGWVKRILRQQGAVVVERMLERQQDFAMEFWMDHGDSFYLGMNIFNTDAHGHFIENLDMPEREMEQFISSMLRSPQELVAIRRWYMERLSGIASWYRGPVGVDMLVTVDGALYPCVEINWRMTMGMATQNLVSKVCQHTLPFK